MTNLTRDRSRSQPLLLESSVATDQGLVRPMNEDSLASKWPTSTLERLQRGAVWVIADGVGPQARGMQASRLAAQAVTDAYWHSAIPDPKDRLRRAIDATNATLYTQNPNDGQPGDLAGATCLAAVVVESKLILGHVGRSRAYLLRDGTLSQLTSDHTWVADQIRAGRLAPDEAQTHPRRNMITRCLGIRPTIRTDLIEVALRPGDTILLCSDGLHREVPDADISRILSTGGVQAAHLLVEEANRRGGQDNITTIVIHTMEPVSDAETSADRVALLNRIGRELAMSLDLDATLASVMTQLIAITGAERGAVLLADERGNLVERAQHNAGSSMLGPYSTSIASAAMRDRTPVLIANALDDPYLNTSESIVDLAIRSVLCVPLIVKEDAIGVLYVDSSIHTGVFSQDDLDLLVSFASQAAVSIENARLHARLLQQTRQIELTRQRQESLVRSLSSGLVAIDNQHVVTDWNPAATEILGITAANAVGMRIQDVLPSELMSWLGALIAQSDGNSQTFIISPEWEGSIGERPRVILAARAARIRGNEGDKAGFVFIINDRTDIVMLDEARAAEREERNRMRTLFQRYLAPSVAERALQSPDAVKLGGSRQDVAILFADVRGFTGFSEQRTPEEVVAMLNHYLALATQEIFAQYGTLDKFLGDGVMAIFGAPVPVENKELAAVRAALGMRSSLERLRAETGVRVGFGIGLNTGQTIVGNIGTVQLMNYTAIGDVVNVAARLQAEARSGEILISEAILERVRDAIEYEELGPLYVKGRAVPVGTYKLLGLKVASDTAVTIR
jgi:adenylate cyclase